MLADNQPLFSAGAQLSKLNAINKLPSSLYTDRFYAMDESVMSKSSPEAICIRGGLIVGGILESLGINDNNIISEIQNCIPSPSNLWYVVKKYREAAFMRISGFVCNYS